MMFKGQIRIKSARAPYQRAGVQFGVARQWKDDIEIDPTPEGAARLLVLMKDPVLVVQGKDRDGWRSATADEIALFEALLSAKTDDEREGLRVRYDELAAAQANTQLPTAEPTLERDASEMTPQAKTPENPADQGKAAEELMPPPPRVVNDTSSLTPAQEAPATTVVEEAAPAAKTETRPAPKAVKPKA